MVPSKNLLPLLRRALGRGMQALLVAAIFLGLWAAWKTFPVGNLGPLTQLRHTQAYLEEAQKRIAAEAARAQRLLQSAETALAQAKSAMDRAEEARQKSLRAWAWLTKWGEAWQLYLAEEAAQKEQLAQARADYESARAAVRDARALSANLGLEQNANSRKRADVERRLAGHPLAAKASLFLYNGRQLFYRWWWAVFTFILFAVTPAATWLRRTLVWFGPGLWVEKGSRRSASPRTAPKRRPWR